MMRSTTSHKGKQMLKKIGTGLAVAAFWLAVWQVAYLLVAQEILLVSPVHAVMRLVSLAGTRAFWYAVASTCLHVLEGFCAALVVGALLAAACARFPLLRTLTAPLLGVIKATPVASFIILALVWLATDSVPGFSAFLMVLPVVWGNLSAGIASADKELLEMAAVFRFTRVKKLRYIYIPAVLPHFVSACTAGLGFAWKSAVAAEVIAHPRWAIGREIYNAKIYLEIADLFAWTMAVILLSLLLERVALWLLRTLNKRLSGPAVTVERGG